jgi:hypothetical protein
MAGREIVGGDGEFWGISGNCEKANEMRMSFWDG